jgi:transcriptional regulator with GAF, ATPase, and Fis domain
VDELATRAYAGGANNATPIIRPYHAVMENERATIADAIQRTGGNKSQAARVLGLTLRQLNYRLARFGMTGSPTKR